MVLPLPLGWTAVFRAMFRGRRRSGSRVPNIPDTSKSAFDGLTDSVICAGLLFYSMAVAAVYVLRYTQPLVNRPYKTWGYPFTPAFLMLAYAGTFVSLLIQHWSQTMGVLGLIAAGVAYYYAAIAVRRRRCG